MSISNRALSDGIYVSILTNGRAEFSIRNRYSGWTKTVFTLSPEETSNLFKLMYELENPDENES